MLIRLQKIDTEDDLKEAGEHPLQREDCGLYVTADPAFARALAKEKLPCIFVERHQKGRGKDSVSAGECGADVWGVDMVISEHAGEEQSWDWRHDEQFLLNVWKRHYKVPWVIAVTDRLLIRESAMADLPRLFAIYHEERGNPDVKPFSGQPEEELRAYIETRYPLYGYGLWSVVEKASRLVIGRVGFEDLRIASGNPDTDCVREVPELAYLIDGQFRRQGYAKEAACAVLAYARGELGFGEVYLRASKENAASQRLAAGLGFQREEKMQNLFRLDLTSHQFQSMIYNHI